MNQVIRWLKYHFGALTVVDLRNWDMQQIEKNIYLAQRSKLWAEAIIGYNNELKKLK
jgi:hypothetical protein